VLEQRQLDTKFELRSLEKPQ